MAAPLQAGPEASGAESDVRTILIETAVDCLASRGYRGTTVEGVAHAAGWTKGAVYWHFRDKDALVASAIDFLAARWLAGLRDHLDQLDRARERLDRLFDNFLRLALHERPVCIGLHALTIELRQHPVHAAPLRLILETTARLVHEIITGGQAEGTMRPDVDARTVAHSIVGSLGGALVTCSYGADGVGFGPLVRSLKQTYGGALLSAPLPRSMR
ncbi:MAG: TetR/AcrR family transcriptional regulator [Acidobacteriota bacterium]